MMLPRTTLDRYSLSGIGAILLWSTTVALARSLSDQVGALTAVTAVHLIGGFFAFTYLLARRRAYSLIVGFPRRYLIGCGSLFVLYMLALYQALGLAGNGQQVLQVALLNYLWPALTILFSLVLLRKKGGALLLPGTVVGLTGVLLVMTPERISIPSFVRGFGSNPPAFLLALLAAVSWALYSNLTRRWAGASGRGAVPLFIIATGLVLLIARLLRPEVGNWSVRAAIEAVVLGLFTLVAYVLWDIAMRGGRVVRVAVWSYSIPIISTLFTCAYLGISATPRLWIGCFLIVLGAYLSWISVSDRR